MKKPLLMLTAAVFTLSSGFAAAAPDAGAPTPLKGGGTTAGPGTPKAGIKDSFKKKAPETSKKPGSAAPAVQKIRE